ISADRPTQLLQALNKRRCTTLHLGVIGTGIREHADAPHPLALLRARRKRPRNPRAGEQRDELAPVYLSPRRSLRHGRTWSGHPRLCGINEPSRGCRLFRATPHSITSSARLSNGSGTVKPSAFAVLRLMINSIFVACCTGRSAGFSPLR